jgi:hypothetical protein
MFESRREFLKDTIRLETDSSQVDQHRGIPPPLLEKPFPADAPRIDLEICIWPAKRSGRPPVPWRRTASSGWTTCSASTVAMSS